MDKQLAKHLLTSFSSSLFSTICSTYWLVSYHCTDEWNKIETYSIVSECYVKNPAIMFFDTVTFIIVFIITFFISLCYFIQSEEKEYKVFDKIFYIVSVILSMTVLSILLGDIRLMLFVLICLLTNILFVYFVKDLNFFIKSMMLNLTK